MRERIPCVYILATGYHGALYTGVTSSLVGRLMQHREGRFEGYSKKYGIVRLVCYGISDTMAAAIHRERQLKRYKREWKRNLIERQNPACNDLAAGFGLGPLTASPGATLDPGTSPG